MKAAGRFKEGDRVRLSAAGREAGVGPQDAGRLGTVAAEPQAHHRMVSVRWDGLGWPIYYAAEFVERADEGGGAEEARDG